MANTTWDAATVTAVTLSGGNLVATNTGTTSGDQGAHAPFADGQTSGKFYFEVTLTTYTGGAGVAVGVGTTAATYSGLSGFGTGGDMCFAVGHTGTGTIFNGSNTGLSIGARTSGNVIGIAVDLINRRIWWRLCPTGLWNGDGSSDPTAAPGTGGGPAIPAGTIVPFVTYGSGVGGAAGVAGNVWTANFGDSAFSGAVPSGYTAGWPKAAAATSAINTQMLVEEWGAPNPAAQLTQLLLEEWMLVPPYGDMRATQVGAEQWARMIPPQMQATQAAIEQWTSTANVTTRMLATQAAIEQWSPVASAVAAVTRQAAVTVVT